MGASPGGIIDDHTIVEIKCPFKCRDEKKGPESVDFLCIKDDRVCLKESHNYFYQIQGQLLLSGRTQCQLIVYTNVDFLVVPVLADPIFQEHMLDKLFKFYNNVFKEILIEERVYKGTDKLPVPYV